MSCWPLLERRAGGAAAPPPPPLRPPGGAPPLPLERVTGPGQPVTPRSSGGAGELCWTHQVKGLSTRVRLGSAALDRDGRGWISAALLKFLQNGVRATGSAVSSDPCNLTVS